MQRSKAAAGVGVKQVIVALCRLLAATGLDSVPAPEAFRRAKFSGGPEVEDQFWQLLANILQRTTIVSYGADSQLMSGNKKLVVAGLWQTGFQAEWMYGRVGGQEGGERRSFSSRELLLALGWLLATGTLERLLTQRAQQLDKTLLTSPLVNPEISHHAQLDAASLRRMQWLIGFLRFQGRTLLSMQEEKACLLHAVLSSSPLSSFSNQSSTLLRVECVRMWQLCQLLEAYVSWKQVENLFWVWMDSVVDCHLTALVVMTPRHATNRRTAVCCHGNRGLKRLNDILSKLPKAQRGQRRAKEDASEREGSLFSLLLSLPSLPATYRARLQDDRPDQHTHHPAEGVQGHSGTGTLGELQAPEARRLLLQAEAQLLEGRDRHKLANRLQVQEMVGRLQELVLIPP
ncbi:tubulin epsilon and delta complex protein 1 isoform X2 [Myripristis murdjan]|uniref:tubulin epsilon and delta complex protein 1 isoform X2 n=1 Tax=Myripristis murdjan TaxID=586833 RepID=UPI001175D732|nr:tubulin epsilon and delta complex protein 1 isoform X2 [Myripristis murdjan]